MMDELRRKGLEKMNEVYAWEMPDVPGEFFALTVEHLFGRIWTRDGLSMRDRRMMLIAVLTTLNQEELLEVQVNAVLQNAELTREELREMAIFLTHYVGFPLGSKLDGVIKRVAAKRKKAATEGAGDDKKANVNAVVAKHAGKSLG
ncbi:MAG TPA: carboxymuconolactone decarboxylase family protein [Mycobacterium sp.]|nr:carboxymuconolactone decarboxylase family protein [Mycobacterium sp.]